LPRTQYTWTGVASPLSRRGKLVLQASQLEMDKACLTLRVRELVSRFPPHRASQRLSPSTRTKQIAECSLHLRRGIMRGKGHEGVCHATDRGKFIELEPMPGGLLVGSASEPRASYSRPNARRWARDVCSSMTLA